MKFLVGLFLVTAVAKFVAAADDDVCVSETNTYTVRVNLFVGELGYFTFDECPSMISPTIGMKIGETYTFNQSHRTNYYHPLGFSYYADGAHDEQDELEPGIAPYNTSSSCADTLSCPSPMYFRNGTYLGTYSNIPEVLDITQGEDNFGLDDYEPLFFRPLKEWAGFGDFEVKLRFNVEDFTKDIFYFCHVRPVCFRCDSCMTRCASHILLHYYLIDSSIHVGPHQAIAGGYASSKQPPPGTSLRVRHSWQIRYTLRYLWTRRFSTSAS